MSAALRRRAGLLVAVAAIAGAPAVARGQDAPLPAPDAPAPVLSPIPSGRLVLAAGALLGGAFLLDRYVREEAYLERDGALSPLASAGSQIGRQSHAFAALGALYAAGRATNRPGLSDGAMRAGAGLLATGLVDQAVKFGVGRERPRVGGDADEFAPGSSDGSRHAFPSHHTAVAFSLATSVAEETDDVRLAALAYGVAGLVGWSRVYHDEHWASDVVGGAIVGTLATRATSRWLRARDGGAAPQVGLSPRGATVRLPLF